MKADLHIHSKFSADGVSSPEEILAAAVRRGLGCIAVTDHNHNLVYDILKDNAEGIIIIPAEEVSSAEGHILAYGILCEIEGGMSIQDTIDAIHEAGGYAFAAHPYRWWSGLGEANVRKYNFDGTEGLNARSISRANRMSLELAKELGKPISAGSDSHMPRSIGRGTVEFSDDLKTWEEVVDALMNSRAKVTSRNRGVFGTIHYGCKAISQWIGRGFQRI